MTAYVYSLVRCVPEPRTGEFINIGAVAGDASSSDWSIRQIGNEARARRLASPTVLGAVHEFLAQIGDQIDRQATFDGAADGSELTEEWLVRLHRDMRNVTQLSEPALVVADSAESALDIVFSRLLIDPVAQSAGVITRQRVFGDLRKAYLRELPASLVQSRVELFVGDRLHAPIDFAIGNGHAVQLAQTWSFQRASIEEVSTQIKAWGYTIGRLRAGDEARVLGADARVSTIESSAIDLEVLLANPLTPKQQEVYDEASDIFSELNARVIALEDADQISARAKELVGIGAPPRLDAIAVSRATGRLARGHIAIENSKED